jgi:hypothetical protein
VKRLFFLNGKSGLPLFFVKTPEMDAFGAYASDSEEEEAKKQDPEQRNEPEPMAPKPMALQVVG